MTNSLTTVMAITSRPNLKVIMTGGVVRPSSCEAVGVLAENTFNAINVGTAILGTDGRRRRPRRPRLKRATSTRPAT